MWFVIYFQRCILVDFLDYERETSAFEKLFIRDGKVIQGQQRKVYRAEGSKPNLMKAEHLPHVSQA